MDARIVNTTDGLEELQQSWERLEQQDPDITFYSTFRFMKAWWDSFSRRPEIRLHILCLYQNQTLAGIGPFVINTQRRGFLTWNVLQFAGRGDYLNVLIDRSLNPDTILKYMFKALENNPDWDILRLTNVSATSQLAAYLLRSGDNQYFQHQIENPYVDLRNFLDFAQFKAQNLPGKVVKLRNKLGREVGFHFQVVPGNKEDIFFRISQLHRQEKDYLVRQGRKDRRSLYEDEHISRFVQNVFARTDNVLTFLYNDKESNLLGYKTCYLYNRVLLAWNGGYNPQYYKYSIGKVLYYDILDHIMENDLADRFDWGAGRYPWKFEWTNNFTSTYKLEKPITKKGRGYLRTRKMTHTLNP